MTKNRRKLVLAQRRRVNPNRVLWLVEIYEDATMTLRCGTCERTLKYDPWRKQRKRRSWDLAWALRWSEKIGAGTATKRFFRGDCKHCTKVARDERYPLPPVGTDLAKK